VSSSVSVQVNYSLKKIRIPDECEEAENERSSSLTTVRGHMNMTVRPAWPGIIHEVRKQANLPEGVNEDLGFA